MDKYWQPVYAYMSKSWVMKGDYRKGNVFTTESEAYSLSRGKH